MSWDQEKYFAKAQRYWALASALERDSDQYLLLVSFFCEFFVRGCLVQYNPVLNAVIEEESIIYAAGLSPKTPAKAVDLKTAIQRLQRLVPEVTEAEVAAATALSQARNSELHGDLDGIASISNNEIIPNLFSLIVKLASFSKQDLAALMGEHGAIQAKNTAEAIAKDRKRRVRELIKIQKDRFFSLPESEQKKLRDKARPSFASAVTKSGRHIKTQKCPSCAELGLLAGIAVGHSSPILKEDELIQEVRVQPEVFNCKCCSLNIKGLDELIAAGFPHEFVASDHMDPLEYFRINPMDYVDTDEIIRQYGEDMYGYQDE